MSDEKPPELGLYILRRNQRHGAGTELWVTVVKKSENGKSIRNMSESDVAYGRDKMFKGRTYANLEMRGHVFDASEPYRMIGHEPCYYDIYAVERAAAVRMAKTLVDWDKARTTWTEENGYQMSEAQMFALFAKFVGAKFVVHQDASSPHRVMSDYDNCDWGFNSIAGGVTLYSRLVEEDIRAAVKRKAA